MFGGWDINKLVEGATALVSDAQQDIASWDRREDATDASTSAELEVAGANEWNFDAISGITDAFKLDASRIPSLSAYLTSTEESAPPNVIPETGHIPGSGVDSSVTELREPVIQAASQAVSSDTHLSPVGKGGSSGGKGRSEVLSSKRLSRGSSGSQLGAKKLIRAPSTTLQGASSSVHTLPAPSEAAACPEVCLEPPSEPESAAEHTAGVVPNGPAALAAQQADLGSSQEESPPSVALNSAEHQHSPARASASAYSASGIGKSREESTPAEPPLRPATVAGEYIDAHPGIHAAGSVHVECRQESEPASEATAASEDTSPASPTVSPTEALDPARDRSPAKHAPHSEQRSPSDRFTASEKSSLLSPIDSHTSAVVVISRPDESASEQRPALNGTTASAVENIMPKPHPAAQENGAPAQSISPCTESAPVSSRPVPQPATDAADGSSDASHSSTQPPGDDSAEVSADEADQVGRLQEALAVRERQLERKSAEVSEVQAICDQLQRKNEELAQRVSVVSEADLDAVRTEFETRLAASDRKVYALSKERDALRRGNEKLATLSDLLKEKDAIISQVMEEGERLSKKQAQLEGNCKKLRAAAKEAAAQKSTLDESLAHEQSSNASTQLQLEQDNAALQAAQEAHSGEMQQAKHHYESLLAHARSSQVAAEQKAASTVQEGTAKRLKESDRRCESLEESLEELRVNMDRQRAMYEMREERLKREVTELERRGEEAELRHEELSAKLPAATRPLLRQMEAMQASAAAADGAWVAAERHLTSRVADAEAQAAAAAEKERMAVDRLQAAQSRLFSISAALDAERAEAAVLAVELDAERQRSSGTSRAAARAEEHMRTSAASAVLLRDQLKQAAGNAALELAAHQSAAELRLASAEDRVAELLARVHAFEATAPSTEPRPPVMPGPGHKWILVKEGQPAAVPVLSEQRQAPSALQPRAERAYLAGAGLEGGGGSAPQLARLQEVLQHRDNQLASLQDQMRQLESTRDSLAEELVSAAQAADSAQAAIEATAAAEAQAQGAQQRLAACEELLGERDERLEEMRADLEDVRSLYKDQFLELLNELDRARSSDSSPAARQSPATATLREPNDFTIA